MTPELHRILAQERYADLTHAAEHARVVRQGHAATPLRFRARLIVRFVPSFMHARPAERTRVRPGAWVEGEG